MTAKSRDMQNTVKPGVTRAWQLMLSGRRLDLLNPQEIDIEIDDIAHGLARVSRWNGQTAGKHAFSVAQHSLLVEHIAAAVHADWTQEQQLAALLHDAAEYVIGDLISPFKSVIGGEYRDVEQRLMAAIRRRFALPSELPKNVESKIKSADRIAAFYEATLLAGFQHAEAVRFFGSPPQLPEATEKSVLALEPWPGDIAQQKFLERFRELTK